MDRLHKIYKDDSVVLKEIGRKPNRDQIEYFARDIAYFVESVRRGASVSHWGVVSLLEELARSHGLTVSIMAIACAYFERAKAWYDVSSLDMVCESICLGALMVADWYTAARPFSSYEAWHKRVSKTFKGPELDAIERAKEVFKDALHGDYRLSNEELVASLDIFRSDLTLPPLTHPSPTSTAPSSPLAFSSPELFYDDVRTDFPRVSEWGVIIRLAEKTMEDWIALKPKQSEGPQRRAKAGVEKKVTAAFHHAVRRLRLLSPPGAKVFGELHRRA
ncbi:hypothetical protein OF83DRAFT_724491 [Amylostereum chailletii]|nr:hypothetical protein OF83DRAFT_724491 [Amylostereum chailletii]